MEKKLSNWQGSENTKATVMAQIATRFGEERAKEYDPMKNCFTFNHWKSIGYTVKKGEKALRSVTFITKDNENGKEDKFMRSVCLFFIDQVEKYESKES